MSKKSITAKTQNDRLRRAIARRKRAQTVTHLFDHSLPTSHLFRGVFPSSAIGSLSVSTDGSHKLSPYVIHLKDPLPTPEDILAREDMAPIRLNLLVPESHLRPVEDIAKHIDPHEDLTLSGEELAGQLTEDAGLALPRVRWTLPSIQLPVLAKQTDGRFASTPEFSPLSLDAFTPPEPPTDFLSYFDFPEEEAELEEAEPVLLDHLEESAMEHTPSETQQKWQLPRLRMPQLHLPAFLSFAPGWSRALGAFVLLSFAFTLPIHAMNTVSELRETKGTLEVSGRNAMSALEAGANAMLVRDGAGAATSFSEAADQFSGARDRIKQLGTGTSLILSTLPATQKSYRAGKNLVNAGESLSIAGERIADGFVALSRELNPTPTSRMKLLSTYTESALPHLKEANTSLEAVNLSALPEDQQVMLADLQGQLPILISSLEQFVEFTDMASVILGDEGTKRYLVVFQNNTEMRPTGGFMGSFAELSVTNGEITNMNLPGGGTYDMQGSLSTYTIAPKPLQLLKARWELQDANWFADFPTSARQILDFYYDAGGPTMDGVIAINATYVADLFNLLGPIEMPAYDRTINAENFVFETMEIIDEHEREVADHAPKTFLGDLAPVMLERMMEKGEEDFLAVVDRVNQGLSERNIQLYFTRDELQREMLKLGWAGELKFVEGDYLMVVDTNLGGGKTSGVIEQDVHLDVHIDENGVITNTLSITRTHHGIRGAAFSGVNNVDYLRVYVPKGSELLEADGFSIPDESLFEYPLDGWTVDDDLLYIMETEEVDPISETAIFEESGKTVFGNWVQTKPGTQSTATFTYRLPFTIESLQEDPTLFNKMKHFVGFPNTEEYRLTVQKQSGVLDRTTRVTVHTPDSLETLWSSHDLEEASFTNQTDAFIAALFEHQLP